MTFQLIIHQFFVQHQNEMNSTRARTKACGSLITLISNKNFVEKMKRVIENVTQKLSESEQTDQIKIGLLKYETRKSAITNSKKTSQIAKRGQRKKNLKKIEFNLNSEANFNEYTKCKNTIELIYKKNAEGVKIRSKC